MVAPKKMIMGRGESAVSIGRARSIARKPVVKVKPKTKTKVAEPKSNVKKVNSTLSAEKKAVRNAGEDWWLKNVKSGKISRTGASLIDTKTGKKPTIKINSDKTVAKKNRNIK